MALPSGAEISMRPHDVIVFSTPASAEHCLVGLVAATPTILQRNGDPTVLVQPRPLILVSLSHLRSASSSGSAATGYLVETSDPFAMSFTTASFPSSTKASNDYKVPPLNSNDISTVMRADEVQELQEHRASLRSDLHTSNSRVQEIDALLRHGAELRSLSPASAEASVLPRMSALQRSSAAVSVTSRAVRKASKTAEVMEKELLLARVGLRTVKPCFWAQLQQRESLTAAEPLVRLIETAVVPLHDETFAAFDDVVARAATIPKRLTDVSSSRVTTTDLEVMEQFLAHWPTAAAMEAEFKAAEVLHRWVYALAKAARALVHQPALLSTEQGGDITTSPPIAGLPPQDTATSSPLPTLSPLEKLSSAEEAALRHERSDHVAYVKMAEEELKAIDALLTEATALTASARARGETTVESDVQEEQAMTSALVIPLSHVVGVLSEVEAPFITSFASQPRGTPVKLPVGASAQLSTVVSTAALSAVTSTSSTALYSQALPAVGLPSVINEPSQQRANIHSPVGGSGRPGPDSLRSASGSSQPSLPVLAASASPLEAHEATFAPVSELLEAQQRTKELEERLRLLEARLSVALQQNPRVTEVQLLRDELEAKRSELSRVTDERDRLLQERRARSSRYTSSARQAAGGGMLGSTATDSRDHSGARALSSPRHAVDRGVVEELEEQLNTAHQRISGLLRELSEAQSRATGPLSGHNLKASARSSPSSSALPKETDRVKKEREGDAAESLSPQQHAVDSPRQALQTPPITREQYEQLQSRLVTVAAELDAQQKGTRRLEEQLNDALHHRSEAERLVATQQRELEKVWEKLEAAEARAEERDLLQQQQHLFFSPTLSVSSQPIPAPSPQPGASITPSSVMAISNASQSPQHPPLPPTSPSPLLLRQALRLQDPVIIDDAAISSVDLEAKPRANEDTATGIAITTAANAAKGNTSVVSMDVCPPSSTSLQSAGLGGVGATVAGPTADRSSASRYSRVPWALQSRPVEQLSVIELRHEVHRLREEVERHQSSQMKMAMELQTIREKRKATHRRHRDAQAALQQMRMRMQSSIADTIEETSTELEAIRALLANTRDEAEVLVLKKRMGH